MSWVGNALCSSALHIMMTYNCGSWAITWIRLGCAVWWCHFGAMLCCHLGAVAVLCCVVLCSDFGQQLTESWVMLLLGM